MGVETLLVRWLISKIYLLLKDEKRLGFVGSRKGKNMDLMLNLKRNKGGIFLSMLCYSSSSTKNPKCLYFPKGSNASGWNALVEALS